MARPPQSIPYTPHIPDDAPGIVAKRFYETMRTRRSVRFFSDTPVAQDTIRWCIAAAGTAPSGANKQPWRFIAVSDPAVKRAIRLAAEAEEREFYSRRYLADLAALGTDPDKSFLEVAPWLIVVFKLTKTDPDRDGRQGKVYHVDESVGIACGMLITALHLCGLVTLTHTPSPMAFLSKVLKRPAHEKPYLLLPVGYPSPDCVVPDIYRKPFGDICEWHTPESGGQPLRID
jgi:iodotyrosine deiodinase